MAAERLRRIEVEWIRRVRKRQGRGGDCEASRWRCGSDCFWVGTLGIAGPDLESRTGGSGRKPGVFSIFASVSAGSFHVGV